MFITKSIKKNYGNINMKKVLIVCALEIETQGQLEDYDVLYTGVGKVNATLKLTQKFGKFGSHIPYDLVINYGTAGSQVQKYVKGDLVDCTQFVQRDMDVSGLGFKPGQTPFEEDVPTILHSNSAFNPIRDYAVCGTGDSFVQEKTVVDVQSIVDMEAYALAKVCSHYKVPFISFKYITDDANVTAGDDWLDNVPKGIVKFKEKVLDKLKNNS